MVGVFYDDVVSLKIKPFYFYSFVSINSITIRLTNILSRSFYEKNLFIKINIRFIFTQNLILFIFIESYDFYRFINNKKYVTFFLMNEMILRSIRLIFTRSIPTPLKLFRFGVKTYTIQIIKLIALYNALPFLSRSISSNSSWQ